LPRPLYFHPFNDHRHSTGIGLNVPSSLALRAMAPTVGYSGHAHYKYLWKMGAGSLTFQAYVAPADRIYVMGHCVANSNVLKTQVLVTGKCTDAKLANLFQAHGLPAHSQAHIRILACNSATPPVQVGAQICFAERLKARMTGLGYAAVTVRGYDTPVGIHLGWQWAGLKFWESADSHAHDY